LKALIHLVKKEFIQLRRTPAMMGITIGVPIIQLLILGFAISSDIIHVPTAITDLDNSAASRSLVERLENTRYLDVRYRPGRLRESDLLLQDGRVLLAVTVPRGFEKKLVRGEKPAVSLTVDAQNTNVAVTGAAYARNIVMSWAGTLKLPGRKPPVGFNLVNLKSRIWYNQELKFVYYMVPGIVVLLVTIITTLLTSMSIVREREMGTLEQLMVTPITRLELILGKTVPFAILGFFELCFALFIAKLVYGIQISGSIPLFLALSILYIFCTLGMGIFISTIVHTQQQALFTAWFFLVFFLLMSGFFLPLESMPRAAYYLTYLDPFRYFMSIVRNLFLKGSGLRELLPDAAALAVIAVVVNTAAVKRFNKRLG